MKRRGPPSKDGLPFAAVAEPLTPLPLATRLWFAWVCFFRVLADPWFGARAYEMRDLPPGPTPPPQLPPPEEKPPEEPKPED